MQHCQLYSYTSRRSSWFQGGKLDPPWIFWRLRFGITVGPMIAVVSKVSKWMKVTCIQVKLWWIQFPFGRCGCVPDRKWLWFGHQHPHSAAFCHMGLRLWLCSKLSWTFASKGLLMNCNQIRPYRASSAT